jgi:hypothetical protein
MHFKYPIFLQAGGVVKPNAWWFIGFEKPLVQSGNMTLKNVYKKP